MKPATLPRRVVSLVPSLSEALVWLGLADHLVGVSDWCVHPADAMAICPCSMGTIGAIAGGLADNLIERAADVMLKERRPLVLVPRETPLSAIHLENLLKLARMGVSIVPPMPAFYNHPQTIDDMVDHIVTRVLDQFGLPAEFARRWTGEMRAKVAQFEPKS